MKIFRNVAVLILLIAHCSASVNAEVDELIPAPNQPDSLSTDDTAVILIPDDSTVLQHRAFDSEVMRELKEDSDMHYKQPPSAAESIWSRIMRWFGEILRSIFGAATGMGWLKILIYVIGIGIVIALVMLILRVNAFKVLFGARGAPVKMGVIEENIHEMDFDQLIREAVDQGDYRRGVRLLFLHALKILSDKHLIRWEPGKTNHEYVGELQQGELREGLDDLSYYFDYAWYGNFGVTSEIFQEAQSVFSNWKQVVR